MGEKWEVAIIVAVELNGPVVEGTCVANCGESGWRIQQSGGWWSLRNGKWQDKWVGNLLAHGWKWEVAMIVSVKFNGPVVAKVKDTSVANCGEGGWRIYQSGG